MKIHILDVGSTKYGDCILIIHGNRNILIDAAHPGDTELITGQLTALLGDPPFKIDLLIVTHCHLDHIGCMPNIARNGHLKAAFALVADEKLGFGRTADGEGPSDAAFTLEQKALIDALMEEDHSSLPQDQLEQFLMDAAKLEDNYKFLLTQLKKDGTKIIRFKGIDNTPQLAALEKEFKDFGLKVLGPTKDHLFICAESLSGSGDEMVDNILKSTSDSLSIPDLAEEYKNLVNNSPSDAEGIEDRPGAGAAKNNQSIVLKLKAGGWSALLAADMQFAKAEVSTLDPFMKKLYETVNNAGPYNFIKLTHHASYNGLNEAILNDWLKNTKLFAHTGGINDPGHPDKGVLKYLKAKSKLLKFARTDRNEQITVEKTGNTLNMKPATGKLNDFTENADIIEASPPAEVPSPGQINEPPELQVTTSSLKDGEYVEIIAKVPHTSTRVVITIEVDPQKKNDDRVVFNTDRSSKRLENLIFITSPTLLERNIGKAEAGEVLSFLNKISNSTVVELPPGIVSAKNASLISGKQIRPGTKGIVIVGGYDIVPSLQLDVLDSKSREKLRRSNKNDKDADNFIVWSDDIYGDKDGDTMPELPVSRIPDGRLASLLLTTLQAPAYVTHNRFGVRNIHRPFAADIFEIVPGNKSSLQVSEKFGPQNFSADSTGTAVYYMLHGSSNDGTRFWGETEGGDGYEAVNINNIPKSAPGAIVFTGCCWGALSAKPIANEKTPATPLRPLSCEESIALSYLKAGALAYVGCTGSHYSPLNPPYNYYGKPMHDEFWKGIKNNLSPAQSLFNAKKEFAKNLPHGQKDIFSQAVEAKILRQYTCLGLGW